MATFYEIYPQEAIDLCLSLGIERSLTVDERNKIDDSDFAWPDAPGNPKYPINTQAHLDAAAKLIGRAPEDKQAAIKDRAIKIAKRKGFTLPESWQAEEDGKNEDRAMTATFTRAANHEPMSGTHTHAHPAFGSQGDDATHEHEHTHDGDNNHEHNHADRSADAPFTPENLSIYAPIVRTDPKEWVIEGQVTSDQIDHYGTIFDYEASKEAFQTWRGNIREQHDSKRAVGRAIEVIPDDATRTIFLRARISKGAKDTWEKILDGTLSGFSVGADPRQVETTSIVRNGKSIPVYRVKKWNEVSVVDNPGSPGCDFVPLVRADGFATEVLDCTEDEPSPETGSSAGAVSSLSLERAGARVSSATQGAMHDSIGHTLKAAASQMQNCGCEVCQAAMKMLDPDGDGDIDLGGYDDPDNDADQLYGGGSDGDMDRAVAAALERVLPGAIERALNPAYARLQGIAGTLSRSFTSPAEASINSFVDSAITRAVEAANAAHESSLSEVRADLSAVKETVGKIADTPVPGAPVMHANSLPRPVEKRLATDADPYQMPISRGATADAVAALFASGQLDTTEKQVDAVAAALSAQRRGK